MPIKKNVCRIQTAVISVLLFGVLLGGVACDSPKEIGTRKVIEPWIGEGGTKVLVDSAHQWEARPDFVFDDHEFRYCHSQSTSRLLQNLIAHDFRYRQFREGTLDYQTLKDYDVLFFNIPTLLPGGRSKPDKKMEKLTTEEIDAIGRFVEEGGGLFVVSEHNNAYDHAEVLNPMLEQFGVKIPAAYAREKTLNGYTIGNNSILLRIRHYKKHPVTRKLRETSWLGGGPLETEHGVAFLSDDGHADLGNYITHKPSKHSNRKVEPGEATGPDIPLFAAVEKGDGRVVVIGDHNTLGVQWLGIADNYRFAMNTFAWLAKRENEDPHIADIPPVGVKLGFDLNHTDWNPGLRDRRGFHPMFINFSRDPRLFAMGLLDLADPADVLVLADPMTEYDREDLAKIEARLKEGQRVVLLVDPAEPQPGTVQLLKRFIPGLTMKTSRGDVRLEDLKLKMRNQIERIEGSYPFFSDELDLPVGITGAALKPGYKGRGTYSVPVKFEEATPYLLNLLVDQGAPFVHAIAQDGKKITIARRFSVLSGEILVFFQAKMWSNETFGIMRDEPIHDAAYGSHDLQMAFIRWLAKQAPVIDARAGAAISRSKITGEGSPDTGGDAGP